MSVDLKSPRPDIVFMRRRLKPGQTAAPVTVSTPTSTSNFLNLSQPTTGEVPVTTGSTLVAPTPTAPALPQKPSVARRTVMTAQNPVVRLNAYQSAVGSLTASGAHVFGWQATSREGGVVRVGQDTTNDLYQVPVNGNRKMVEFISDGTLVIGLRHIKNLRRLIISADRGTVTLNLLDGSTILLDTEDGRNVFYISRIDNQIEVRMESVADTIERTFSLRIN